MVLARAARLQEERSVLPVCLRPEKKKLCRFYPPSPPIHVETTAVLFKAFDDLDLEGLAPPSDFSLLNLRAVFLGRSVGPQYFPVFGLGSYQVLPFLALESVSSVSLHMLRDEGMDLSTGPEAPYMNSGYTFPRQKFHFKTIELEMDHSVLGSQTLSTFIQFFSSLKRFSYSFEMDYDETDNEDHTQEMVPSDVDDAIAHPLTHWKNCHSRRRPCV